MLRHAARQGHDDGEDHGRGAYYGRADQHRLSRCFEGIASAVVLFQQMLCPLKVHIKAVLALQFGLDVGHDLDQRQLVDRLCVVGDRAVGIHRDGDRAHAQKSEGDQPECKDRFRNHQRMQSHGADVVSDAHQDDHRDTQPESGEVSGDEPGEDVQRCAAFTRGRDHL